MNNHDFCEVSVRDGCCDYLPWAPNILAMLLSTLAQLNGTRSGIMFPCATGSLLSDINPLQHCLATFAVNS